jgi:hypothetical protein
MRLQGGQVSRSVEGELGWPNGCCSLPPIEGAEWFRTRDAKLRAAAAIAAEPAVTPLPVTDSADTEKP